MGQTGKKIIDFSGGQISWDSLLTETLFCRFSQQLPEVFSAEGVQGFSTLQGFCRATASCVTSGKQRYKEIRLILRLQEQLTTLNVLLSKTHLLLLLIKLGKPLANPQTRFYHQMSSVINEASVNLPCNAVVYFLMSKFLFSFFSFAGEETLEEDR